MKIVFTFVSDSFYASIVGLKCVVDLVVCETQMASFERRNGSEIANSGCRLSFFLFFFCFEQLVSGSISSSLHFLRVAWVNVGQFPRAMSGLLSPCLFLCLRSLRGIHLHSCLQHFADRRPISRISWQGFKSFNALGNALGNQRVGNALEGSSNALHSV